MVLEAYVTAAFSDMSLLYDGHGKGRRQYDFMHEIMIAFSFRGVS